MRRMLKTASSRVVNHDAEQTAGLLGTSPTASPPGLGCCCRSHFQYKVVMTFLKWVWLAVLLQRGQGLSFWRRPPASARASDAACFLLKVSGSLCRHFHSHGILPGPQPEPLCSLRARLEAKEDVVMAGFGGSVSLAGHANFQGFGWAFSEWFKSQYTGRVTFMNLAIGATGPAFSSLCMEGQLRGAKPDIFFIEFSINLGAAADLKRLISTCYALGRSPVVIYVDTFTQLGHADLFAGFLNGTLDELPTLRSEPEVMPVVQAYGLTTISLGGAFRNAPVEGRQLLSSAVFASDRHHLTALGHLLFAELLAAYMHSRLEISSTCTGDTLPRQVMPSSLCQSYYVAEAQQPDLVFNNGNWSVDHLHGRNKIGLRPHLSDADNVGSVVAFRVVYKDPHDMLRIGLMKNGQKGLNGVALVSFDGTPIGKVDGYANWPWNIQDFSTFRLPSHRPGQHLVSFTMLNETHSGGHDLALTTIAVFTSTFDDQPLVTPTMECRLPSVLS